MNKSFFKVLLVFICNFLFLAVSIYSQTEQFRFTHLTNDDGLSQNKVNAIVQDAYGFIWIGTYNGLNRYDGYRIDEFLHNKSDTSSLSTNQINALFVDSKKRLWIGTEGGGLNLYNHEKQTFKNYKHNFGNNKSLCSNDINTIFEDLNGTLWIGTSLGLNKYIESEDCFDSYQHISNVSTSLSNNLITSIHSISPNYLWIATIGGGLNKFNFDTEEFIHYKKHPKGLNDNNIWSVYESANGKVWIGTQTGALNVFYPELNKWEYYGYESNSLKSDGENHVRSIVEGINGDIWIGSDKGGVYQLNHGTNRFLREYRNDKYDNNSLAANSISTIYKAKDDMLWIGFDNGGIDRIDLNQKDFKNLMHSPKNDKTLSNNRINCILQDKDGDYWIATEDGLNFCDSVLNNCKHYFKHGNSNKTINDNVQLTVVEANNGEIWIGTYLGGVNIYDKKTGTFKYLVHNENDTNAIISNFVRTIYEDNNNHMWLGTVRGGLSKYDKESELFTNFNLSGKNGETINNLFVMDIVGDSKSNIYVATYGDGLYTIDNKTKKIQNLKIEETKESISSNHVITLLFDSDSNLWVGTTYGLNKINTSLNTIETYFKDDGLPDNYINALVEDNNGTLWITTNKGISAFDPKTKSFTNYYKSDGLNSDEFIFNSATVNDQGEILLGGINGITYFNPNEIVNVQKQLNVQFTKLNINNKEIFVNEEVKGKIVLHEPIYTTKTINLSYKVNYFSLQFSCMEYSQTNKINFRYWLGSEPNNKLYIRDQNTIAFHNLKPGIHELYVEASANDSFDNQEATKLIIIIDAPYWQQLWFRILATIIGLLISIYFVRIYRIERQKIALKVLVKEKTSDLQEANVLLEENQAELEMNQEELMSQRDLANEQNKKIQLQNKELKKHRENLEILIRERTEELYQAKENAEKADELKSSFLANMSHEIRTPMNAILGFLDILDDPIYRKEERTEFKKLIQSSGVTLLTLIDDIIDIAKIESGTVDIHKIEFNLDNLFVELRSIYSKKVKDIGSKINLRMDKIQSVNIVSDELRIKQVLINLLDNAVKFTENGEVNFGYDIQEDHVQCYVMDTGIGMPKDARDYIFDRFRKHESINGKLYRGTGLGLAISRNIIELLGGSIWVDSKPNKGSKFYFTLPLYKN